MSFPVKKDYYSIDMRTRSLISMRYKEITKAVNKAFWNSESETDHSRYVGSYGRGTAINTSDLDVLVELPATEYVRFSENKGNGPSQLLQTVKRAVASHYATTDMSGDGQVVVVKFSDGMRFEILPAFRGLISMSMCMQNGNFIYPNSNMGGNWLSTNPLAEQEAMKLKDLESNGLLKDTCKHIRYIRDTHFSSYRLSGILIDSFIYEAIGDWHWLREGEISYPHQPYEDMLLVQYIEKNKQFKNSIVPYLAAPGSGMVVSFDNGWEVLGKILVKMV